MQLMHNILSFAALAGALPSGNQDSTQSQLIDSEGALMTSGQCHLGKHYCFSQIIDDLRISRQDILHQYCDQKYKTDWQSCNTCKRAWPLPECWDGPGARSSVFKCTDHGKYEWLGRCDGDGSICAAGTCRWAKANGAGNLALVGNFTPEVS